MAANEDTMVAVTTNLTYEQVEAVEAISRQLDRPKSRLYREAVDLVIEKYRPTPAAKTASR